MKRILSQMEARRTSTAARETPLDARRSSLRIKEDTEPEIVDGGSRASTVTRETSLDVQGLSLRL